MAHIVVQPAASRLATGQNTFREVLAGDPAKALHRGLDIDQAGGKV